MPNTIYLDASTEDAFKSAGLNINDPADVALFWEAAKAVEKNKTITDVAKTAADNRNRSGYAILDEYNKTHPLGEENATPKPKGKEIPQAEMSGIDILDAWNKSHPL